MKRDGKAVILIVDDKPANLFAIENLLFTPERAFVKAHSGEDALRIALEEDIDLIILDVQMPQMDGFEVAQILKSNAKTRDIPIIFASAEKKEHASMMKGYEEGAIDYLSKPLNPEITKAKVSVLLKLRLQHKELIEKNALLEKSALLINNSVDIIGVIDSKTLKIEEINEAFTVISGYQVSEARGSSLLFYVDAYDRGVIEQLKEWEKTKFSFETRLYCQDRTVKWLDWKVVVKYNKWFVNARDITEIKQVERIRNYLATVVKQSNDSIYLHDQEGKIISWNEGAERIYGYSEKEALQMKIWNIIPDYLKPETQEFVNSLLQGSKIHSVETKRVTKHGKLVDVLFSAAVITDQRGAYSSIVITERDITQQKISDEQIRQLNEELKRNILQLEASNKELESFSYSVSHDLRAPLRALNGNARMLEEDCGDQLNVDGKKYLMKIYDNASRMDTLINDLLSFSKIGKREVRKSLIPMEQLVRSIFEESAGHQRGEIKIHNLPDAIGDYVMLQQVWTNLISNAIKYSSKKDQPRITIGANTSPGEVEYFVEDNGAGFDMAYADRLFGTFQRLHDSTEFEGTGIGLAIVQRIVLKHGGTVRAVAEPGKGATFYFTLPLADFGSAGN